VAISILSACTMRLQTGFSLLALLSPSFGAPTSIETSGDNSLHVQQPLIKLKPQHTASRELVSLDGLWKFALASEDKPTASWTDALPKGLECPVPASYNDIFADRSIHDHVGWVLYQRDVIVPKGWSEDHYLIRAEAATHKGRIYVNDQFLVEHSGGYTPFEADITDLVSAGEKFRLTIAVNNELTFETIPPGMVAVDNSTGKKTQTYMHDFYNYAGLARSVWLYSVPQQHITDVTIVTDVKDASGLIHYDVQVAINSTDEIKVSVFDEDGNIVANSTGAQGTVEVSSVNLWQPGAAYLYQVEVSIVDSDDKVIDSYSVATGVRTVEVKGHQFLINGKPFYFTGFGAHEDSEVRGKGHDQAYMVHDFQLRKWIGANSFRTSHYPYAEEVMDFADRNGVVVIDETPAVGLNIALQGGVQGAPTETWKALNTTKAHEQSIRELISRDKNHASVVMWIIANEPAAQEEGAREYFEPLAKLTRELEPTRPISYANQGAATPETDLIMDLFDVTCINRYFGWYSQTGDLEAAEIVLEEEMRMWQDKYDQPIIMTEYGADTISGLHSVLAVPFSEEFQVDMLDVYHRVFDRIEAMAGEHVWNFADFQTSIGIRRVDGNKKGVFTRDRKPKAAAHNLKKRWTGMAIGNETST
jgi:beta-glucuronidase